ncbi:MAG: DapH/DapD/GlmU-related protein [Candidatus Helarchaeota archaeon]
MKNTAKKGKNVIIYKDVKIGNNSFLGNNIELGLNNQGLEIGDDLILRSGSIIYGDVKIGNNFRTGHNVMIREKTIIGNNVLVGTNSIIDGNCVIGNSVNIQSGVYITWGVKIEKDVFIGPRVITTNDKYPPIGDRSLLVGPILRKKCSIGAGSIILPGIEIGENSLIGAGSVVTKNIPKNVIAFGNPCEIIKTRE